MPFSAEDFARTSLVRILPRSRYRLAGQTDSRFQAFASNTLRIGYRQQGATPAFLLFSGPGQDARAAALAAAAWAEANWRPNAIQRTVRPGVVVVQVGPAGQLATAGVVAGAAVPAAVWTVDSETGHVVVEGNPPGSPQSGEIKRAAAALLKGSPVPSLGEVDIAERNVMQIRTIGTPKILTGALSICLILVLLRFGMGGLFSLFALPALISAGDVIAIGSAAVSVLILAGILLGLALLFNVGNLAFRTPGFSSPEPRIRNFSWGAFAAVMVALLVLQQGIFPSAPGARTSGAGQNDEYLHVSATTSDNGGELYVLAGGDVTVDLSGWPRAQWSGVQFKSSNPSVLSLETAPGTGDRPVANFRAQKQGVARVEAASSDGSYSYQVRVDVAARS